jgi:hypothetical protein
MTDPTKRIAKWNAKFNTERIKAILDDLRPDMAAAVAATFPDVAEMETEVKQVLDGIGVPTIQYPFYLAFGRQVSALLRRSVSGESAALETAVLVEKWVARGLAKSTLEAIRTDVFNVGAPVAP